MLLVSAKKRLQQECAQHKACKKGGNGGGKGGEAQDLLWRSTQRKSNTLEIQKSFDEKNIQMLQEAINTLDLDEGKYHLQRCIDSGLWVPGSLEGDEEEEADEEDDS